MIILDSSALLAVLYKEPGFEPYLERIEQAERCYLPLANYVEASVVFAAKERNFRRLDAFLAEAGIEKIDMTPDQAEFARMAYLEYGKGQHPAKLNICDCFTYALAKAYGAPLLFKADDFSKTDIMSAIG